MLTGRYSRSVASRFRPRSSLRPAPPRTPEDPGHGGSGNRYENGDTVRANAEEAVYWLHIAAEHGVENAQLRLARHYKAGGGVSVDHHMAVRWLKAAAESGLPAAQFELGSWYMEGQCVPRNLALFVSWTREAAKNGDVRGLHNLGVAYEQGLGVEQNAHRELAIMIVESATTHDEHAEAVRLFQLAADAEDLFAMEHLAFHLETGLGVQRNAAKAAALERASIEIEQRKETGRREQRIARSGFRVVQ